MNAPLHREMPAGTLDAAAALSHTTRQWDNDIVQRLTDYIQIPAKSPGFDKDWAANGHLETVMRHAASWVEAQKVEGLTLEIVRLPGRTPVLFFEVAATRPQSSQSILMYGHLDKQPEFTGWRNDLGPWTPKYEDGKLYGRGGADDGYAVYASIAAVQALKAQKVAHPRIVGIVETCEESGSYDLPAYIDSLKPRLARSGLSNVYPAQIAHERDDRVRRLAGKIDRVLVDAPCSGLGTLRRNPDLKWRQSPQSVAELQAKQTAILASAARLLKSGGRLVYATCSLLAAENQQVAQAFDAEHGREFVVVEAAQALADAHVEQAGLLVDGPYLRLWPHRHRTDGFFAAVWQRR